MGNPFCHIELNTGDVAKAKAFYRRVFKWKLNTMKMGPGMPYTMIDVGKGVGGGMWKKPMRKQPTQWLPYVEVRSVAKSIDAAKKAGAKIMVPFQPLPGMGAIGVFIDPTRGAIGIWQHERKTAKKRVKRAKKPVKRVAKRR